MIKQITLANKVPYKEEETFCPKKINYLSGGNGTGKTTLAKIIDNPQSFSDCTLQWSSTPIETLVYNQDFVEDNFGQSDSIEGIFTLGKESKDAEEAIAKKREEINDLEDEIVKARNLIEIKGKEFKEKEKQYVKKAWSVKKDYEEHFKPAYWDHIGSRKDFLEKCLAEVYNESELLKEDEIKQRCRQVFSDTLTTYEKIETPPFSSLETIEHNDLFQERIIGSKDVKIGKLIEHLNNSDWVKDGVEYLDKTEDVCPFCQQKVPEGLENEIERFFNEAYQNKIKQLDQLKAKYQELSETKVTEIEQIVQLDVPIMDFSALLDKKEIFEERTKNNHREIEYKIDHASERISLDSIASIKAELSAIIDELNKEIEKNNETANNIEDQKNDLQSQIWRFVVEKLKVDLNSYQKGRRNHKKAIKGISKSLESKKENRETLEAEIEDLESEITGVEHSANEINRLLKSFGFNSFRIQEAEKKGHYALVRDDGKKVGKTLSEGEYTFITFLYFFYLLQGSKNETGTTKSKIVVIDDPISSLDSSVLFVVSNLIKSIAQDVRDDKNGNKQLVVLTHNIYFFKEITFKKSKGQKWNEESYWLIRKFNGQSNINEHEENPIITTYELLWRELDEPKKINTTTVFNTMRRILEYYFNILGGLNYEDAINKFEGEEKAICRALIGWVNDGSHFVNDDLAVTLGSSDITKYLKVFKDIFYKMEHGSHYEMMMKSNTSKN